MKVTLESTTKIVDVVTDRGVVQARVWEGTTESGIAVHAFIPRIAAPIEADLTQFEDELARQRDPSPEIAAWPMRMLL